VVNLVPEGLILLISLTAAVSAFKVAQRGVLAQQLNSIESLASVDIVCTDKTGTLTEPKLRVVGLVAASGADARSLAHELATYAASSPSRNLTLEAIADAAVADVDPRTVVDQVPSPRGGAGARLIWATTDSCSVRRSDSPRAIRSSRSGPARRRAPAAGCLRSGELPTPCTTTAQTRRSPRT
jgi:magnesium-transporting ATPase (P-type)